MSDEGRPERAAPRRVGAGGVTSAGPSRPRGRPRGRQVRDLRRHPRRRGHVGVDAALASCTSHQGSGPGRHATARPSAGTDCRALRTLRGAFPRSRRPDASSGSSTGVERRSSSSSRRTPTVTPIRRPAGGSYPAGSGGRTGGTSSHPAGAGRRTHPSSSIAGAARPGNVGARRSTRGYCRTALGSNTGRARASSRSAAPELPAATTTAPTWRRSRRATLSTPRRSISRRSSTSSPDPITRARCSARGPPRGERPPARRPARRPPPARTLRRRSPRRDRWAARRAGPAERPPVGRRGAGRRGSARRPRTGRHSRAGRQSRAGRRSRAGAALARANTLVRAAALARAIAANPSAPPPGRASSDTQPRVRAPGATSSSKARAHSSGASSAPAGRSNAGDATVAPASFGTPSASTTTTVIRGAHRRRHAAQARPRSPAPTIVTS